MKKIIIVFLLSHISFQYAMERSTVILENRSVFTISMGIYSSYKNKQEKSGGFLKPKQKFAINAYVPCLKYIWVGDYKFALKNPIENVAYVFMAEDELIVEKIELKHIKGKFERPFYTN